MRHASRQQPTPSVFLKPYHVASTTVSPGIAPPPGPRSHHNAVMSRVTLQHTALVPCIVLFSSTRFLLRAPFPHVKPPPHLSSQSRSKRSLSYVMFPPIVPPTHPTAPLPPTESWSFRCATVSEKQVLGC